MPVSESFRRLALQQLSRYAPQVTDRSMFGGVGIYSRGKMFALLAGDSLFLKAGPEDRATFVAAGLPPFKPFGEGGVTLHYYEIPLDWLESGNALEPWVALALEAAATAGTMKKTARKSTPASPSVAKKSVAKKSAAKQAPQKRATTKAIPSRASSKSLTTAESTIPLEGEGPDFSRGEQRLLPAIAQDHATGEVLMMAWMNEESFAETMATGRAVYYSRSRGKLWRKGEESGHMQTVHGVYVDCDADTILLKVSQVGAACHEGFRSCFFRQVTPLGLTVVAERLVQPASVYKNPKSHAKSTVKPAPRKKK